MQTDPRYHARSAAWYSATIEDFLEQSEAQVLGQLAHASDFPDSLEQRDAWVQEIRIIRDTLADVPGWIALEFSIPRLGSRIDVVIISGSAVIPIECKIGKLAFTQQDRNQAWDYALDLKNFHFASHEASIFPLLLATAASEPDPCWEPAHPDGVRPPRGSNVASLRGIIAEAISHAMGPRLDGDEWLRAPYRPTPTIIEAAKALYARHTVEGISRNDAGAMNLATTSKLIESIIDEASSDRFKAILFVTGVPGAGKTLVGLNVATRRSLSEQGATHEVFLSGNGPLVAVLREALTRDELARNKDAGVKLRKGDVALRVKPFIQNVHHFRDEGVRTLDTKEAPPERVVIFDEAQRAWNLAKTADFMKRRKHKPGFDRSEPQFLMEYMNRHADWAVVICLVGGGQEINTGEAGISTWLEATREHFPDWRVYISPELGDSEYAAGHAIEKLSGVAQVELRPELHLSVSMRAFRSERVSAFVKAMLDVDTIGARELMREISCRYPIVLTRSLDSAKRWVREQARGSERYGLVASSQAQRLKPLAVDVRVNIDPVHWFLNDASDTRSSFYLEDAATEYQIQGLELDWTCVTWDADLRFDGRRWQHREFVSSDWRQIRANERQQYLVNAYRVLLTRARQGMAIFVPTGEASDPTRKPEFYDATFDYLRDLGIKLLDN